MRALLSGALLVGALAGGSALAVPGPPAAGVTAPDVVMEAGATQVVPVDVTLPALPGRLDVVVVLDVSTSMTRQLPAVLGQLDLALVGLAAKADLQVGVVLAGTTPDTSSPSEADPARDLAKPAYHPPALVRRVLPVTPWALARPVLRAVVPEVLASDDDLSSYVRQRKQAQLLALHTLLTGEGYAGSPADRQQDAFAAGQVAGWRTGSSRLVIDVTDQPFDVIASVGVDQVRAELAAAHVTHAGLVAGDEPDAVTDLTRLTTARVPTGGLRCGGFRADLLVPAGAPLVCNTLRTVQTVAAAVGTLPRSTRVALVAGAHDATFQGLVGATAIVDAALPTVTRVGVRLTCPASARVSSHLLPLVASVDGAVAGQGQLALRCVPLGAAPRHVVAPPAAGVPAPQPLAAVIPVSPVPPVVVAPQPATLAQQAAQPAAALGVALMPEAEPAASYAAADEGSAALGLLLGMSLVSGLFLLAWQRRSSHACSPARAVGAGDAASALRH